MEESLCKSTPKRIAVVTGGNKGIGLEICRQLASKGVMVILTARDVKRGTEAVEKLKESGLSDVVFHQLDVAEPDSATTLAEFIKNQYQKLDILVNNAAVIGIEWDDEVLDACKKEITKQHDEPTKYNNNIARGYETYEKAQECLNINYHGTKRVTEALIPLLQLSPSPRVVNLSSILGKLRFIPSESIKNQLSDVNEFTEERLEDLIRTYLKDFTEKKLEANGWPTKPSTYKVSKVAISAYTKMMAKRYPTFCINCVDPGFVKTDMTFGGGFVIAEEGAKGPVMLALAPDGSLSGNFYDQTQLSSFE